LFPETVELKEDGFLGIRYGDFVPVLLKAIQEQQKQIEELQVQVNELKQKNKE
jgi:pimeloyl-CoA synthetase